MTENRKAAYINGNALWIYALLGLEIDISLVS